MSQVILALVFLVESSCTGFCPIRILLLLGVAWRYVAVCIGDFYSKFIFYDILVNYGGHCQSIKVEIIVFLEQIRLNRVGMYNCCGC